MKNKSNKPKTMLPISEAHILTVACDVTRNCTSRLDANALSVAFLFAVYARFCKHDTNVVVLIDDRWQRNALSIAEVIQHGLFRCHALFVSRPSSR
jgi:hypothetical protein